MLALIRSRSIFAARIRCFSCSATSASSRACNTSAFESLERAQRAHAIMPAHSISTATVYMTPVKNAAVLLEVTETGFVKPAKAAMAPNKVVYPCWSAAIFKPISTEQVAAARPAQRHACSRPYNTAEYSAHSDATICPTSINPKNTNCTTDNTNTISAQVSGKLRRRASASKQHAAIA